MKDVEGECNRYAELLDKYPVDIVCFGIGENGHIAFNDPPVANFNDPKAVKVVELEMLCRQQQVNENLFDDISLVPTHAITLTIPALLRSKKMGMVFLLNRKRESAMEAKRWCVHSPRTLLSPNHFHSVRRVV